MKIIIVGAGDVGFHLSKLLSFESQDIYLIDMDSEKLDYASSHIDVITIKGDATSVKLLKEINIEKADIFSSNRITKYKFHFSCNCKKTWS